MALNFIASNSSQVKSGPDADSVEEDGAMSTHERRFGHEFLGLLLPLGAKILFRPPTPMLKAQHNYAPKPRAGVFLGWHMLVGGKWSGDYWIGDLEDFEKGERNVRVYKLKGAVRPKR